ncbi:hypothetical protein BBO_08018 [Beauveria brongniartii RCEF 3172]|uniref:HAUS augmin-like complex subunit 6 N-terminal domain-containing protein n=1 Tax=Beauveria brongniartii RCEF 3172 TaxID=1081107 RepID=A0A166YBV6_9HYPO|nr:hypothetical protein BBO_08018 [Beauveria brongniartii RCEF 3172]
MAAAQHSRTRSDRVGAPGAATASRRPLSMHGRPPAPPTPSAVKAAPSPSIPMLLTNMRLLDLDLREDWPAITPATLAGTTQNHKRRVQAVEWALYRLFEIWDPEDTASKLKPHFPAVDQLQSVSLRAALLRGLENAKKKGALGRDALIRKTMLDDCKGERLEEVLAALSSAVLRSTLAGQSRTRPLAVEFALEDRGYQGDGHLLRPLIIAHRASLKRSLEKRRQAAAKFSDFGDLLAMKERGIARRSEILRAKQANESDARISEDMCQRLRQTVRNNWSGNEAWMETLLAGDAAGKESKGLLGTPYDRVWRRVQQGRLAELEDEGRGLLQQLDSRVDAQKQRLARWDELRRDMASGSRNKRPASPLKRRPAPKPVSKGIDLQFNSHKDLHVGAALGITPTNDEQLDEDYATIIDDLDHELTEIKTNSFENAVQRLHNMSAQYGKTDVSVHLSSDPISELSDLEDMDEEDDEPEPAPYYPLHRTNNIHHTATSRLPSRPGGTYADPAAHTLHRSGSDGSYGAPYSEDGYSTASTSRQPSSSHAGNLRQQYTDGDETSWSPPTTSSWAADYMTETTASRGSDSPSPKKARGAISATAAGKPRHTLSLAERTRMSMARRSMQFLQDEEPELPASHRGGIPPLPKTSAAAKMQEEDKEEEDDLASRTRISMAGFEKAQQKARTDRQREMRRELKRARALPPRREGSQWED